MILRKLLKTADGSHTIHLPDLDETYHSIHGAIQESRHVFIEAGLKHYAQIKRSQPIYVFEVGFGTGLNALLASQFSRQHEVKVNYQSIEAFPLESEILDALNYPTEIEDSYCESEFHVIHNKVWNRDVLVNAYFAFQKQQGKMETHELKGSYDICFFDAFAPSKQPELWEKEVLYKIHHALQVGGILVTYCAKGQLKRDLKEIGYEVETLAGPPGKNQMVRATKK